MAQKYFAENRADPCATCRVNDLFATCADSPAIFTTSCLSARVDVHSDFPAGVDADTIAAVCADSANVVFATGSADTVDTAPVAVRVPSSAVADSI